MAGQRKADANITGPGGQPRPRAPPAPTAGSGTSAQTAGRTANAGGNGTPQALAPATAETVNVIGLPGASSMSGGALDRGGGPGHGGFSPPHGWAPPTPTPTVHSPLGNPVAAGGSAPYAIHAPAGYGTGTSGQSQIASPRNTGTGQPHGGNSGGPSSPIWISPAPAMAPSALLCHYCGAPAILVFARVPFCDACYRYAHSGNAPPQRAQIRYAGATPPPPPQRAQIRYAGATPPPPPQQRQLGNRLRQPSSAAPEQQSSSASRALDDASRVSATILNNPFSIISAVRPPEPQYSSRATAPSPVPSYAGVPQGAVAVPPSVQPSQADLELAVLDAALRASARILDNPFSIIPICDSCGCPSGSNNACLACYMNSGSS